MTVKELIDKLQQFDEDKLVLVEDTDEEDGYEVTYPDGFKCWCYLCSN